MIDRAGIRRIIEAHGQIDADPSDHIDVDRLVMALVTENDKLALENERLLDRIRKNES